MRLQHERYQAMLKDKGLGKDRNPFSGLPEAPPPPGAKRTHQSFEDWAPTEFEQAWSPEIAALHRRAAEDPTLVPDKYIEHPW